MYNKNLFYFLSFTWGVPMTLIGCIAAIILIIMGYRPKKWGYCYYFEIGKGWGGINLGIFFITSNNPTEHTKSHEHGHGLQNCFFGPFMPFIVCIPSAIRYWYRKIRNQIGNPCKTNYDDIWFEFDASKRGEKFIAWYNTIQND